MTPARALWLRIETLHAVTYFAPESIAAAKERGLKGFWMGYFGFRAAPLGSVDAATVEATFANFAPAMVARAIPDAWQFASPTQLVDARSAAAATAIRAAVPNLTSDQAVDLATSLETIAACGDTLGRPLFAANLRLPERSDPIERLWHACTTLREHRGDGHLIALASHHIGGCEGHRLHEAAKGTPASVLRENRGFSIDEWAAAGERLRRRGLLDDSGLTETGGTLVDAIEAMTDDLAMAPMAACGIDVGDLCESLDPVVDAVLRAELIPFPNPMGLPKP